MTGYVLQGPAFGASVQPIANATIEVLYSASQSSAAIYLEREQLNQLPNPFKADYTYRCYVNPGRYDVNVYQGETLLWTYKDIEVRVWESPEPTTFAITRGGTPFVELYNYSNFAVLPEISGVDFGAQKLAFSPSGDHLAIACSGSPYVNVFETATWTKLSDPATLPSASRDAIAFKPDGTELVLGGSGNPRFDRYAFPSMVRQANYATMPGYEVNGVSYNHTGSVLAVVFSSAPYIMRYNTATGDLLDAPASQPALAQDVEYSRNSAVPLMIVACYGSEPIIIYDTSNESEIIKLTAPNYMPSGNGICVALNLDASLCALGLISGASPGVTVYNTSDWSVATTFAINGVYDLEFSDDNQYLAVGHGSSNAPEVFRVDDWSAVSITGPGTGCTGIAFDS